MKVKEILKFDKRKVKPLKRLKNRDFQENQRLESSFFRKKTIKNRPKSITAMLLGLK